MLSNNISERNPLTSISNQPTGFSVCFWFTEKNIHKTPFFLESDCSDHLLYFFIHLKQLVCKCCLFVNHSILLKFVFKNIWFDLHLQWFLVTDATRFSYSDVQWRNGCLNGAQALTYSTEQSKPYNRRTTEALLLVPLISHEKGRSFVLY